MHWRRRTTPAPRARCRRFARRRVISFRRRDIEAMLAEIERGYGYAGGREP
jgi:hypothetical protein